MHINYNLPEPLHLPDLSHVKTGSYWLSGEASYKALAQIKNKLADSAPEDKCRILITDSATIVRDIRYFEPHTFVISGHDQQGNTVNEILHYSQLRLRVIELREEITPKRPMGFDLSRVEM